MESVMKYCVAGLLSLLLFACNLSLGGKNMPETIDFFKTQPYLSMAVAIEQEDIAKIRYLASSLDINQTFERGMTFLMWSIAQGKFAATETLLSLGADPNIPVEGIYPLKIAVIHDDIQLLRTLIRYVDINQKINESPVWFETMYAHNWDHMHLFLDKGADVNATKKFGDSAIMILARLKQYGQVLALIERGADITAGLNTTASFAYGVQVHVPDEASPEFENRAKVVRMLEEKGIFFPVKSPREIRAEQEKAGS
jgi:ankyrin repeat protein